MSITWDEVYTYFEFVRDPRWLPHDFNFMSANNHLLNTWLMKVSVFCFGGSELALRLPNVLAGIFFLFSLQGLLRMLIKDKWIRLSAFVLIGGNLYLLDFFSLARGYGLALCMMICAMSCIVHYIKSDEKKQLYLAQLFLALLLLSVLSFIHVWMGMMLFLFVTVLRDRKRKSKMKSAIYFFIIPVVTLALVIPYLLRLNDAGAFYLGKEIRNPFLMISSLSDATLYDLNIPRIFFSILAKIFLLIIPFVFLMGFIKKNADQKKPQLFLLLTFLTAILGPLFLHYSTGSNLLSGRSALFLLPLLLLLFIVQIGKYGRLGRITAILVMLISLCHSLIHANFRSAYDWKEQADVKMMMEQLKSMNIDTQVPFHANIIGTDLPFDLPVNYYLMRNGMTQFGHVARKEFLRNCTYYYTPMDDTSLYRMATIIHYFTGTHTALFRLDDPPPHEQHVVLTSWNDFENMNALQVKEVERDTMCFGEQGTFAAAPIEYSLAARIHIPDSLRGKISSATASFRIRSETRWTGALVIFNITTDSGIEWDAMHVSELPVTPGTWSLSGWTRPVPANAKEVSIYLWNRDPVPVHMDNVLLELLSGE